MSKVIYIKSTGQNYIKISWSVVAALIYPVPGSRQLGTSEKNRAIERKTESLKQARASLTNKTVGIETKIVLTSTSLCKRFFMDRAPKLQRKGHRRIFRHSFYRTTDDIFVLTTIYNFISTVKRTPGDLCKPLGAASTTMKGDFCVVDLPGTMHFIELTLCEVKRQHRTIF